MTTIRMNPNTQCLHCSQSSAKASVSDMALWLKAWSASERSDGKCVQDARPQVRRSGSVTKGWLTLDKSLNLSEPHFPYLQNRDK